MSQRYLGGVITANPTTPTLASASGVWTLEQQFQYAQTIQPKIIGNSVRLRSSASAYFSRITWTSANRTTWTSSLWIKRGALSSLQTIMGSYDGVSSYASRLYFTAGDALAFDFGGSAANTITTSAVFRDPSAWYHIVLLIDTTQVTAANRIGIYVNGVLQTTTGTPVAQNTNTLFWVTSNNAYFGIRSGSDYLDGYLAEINVINGQALTPSSFGAFDSTGVWQPLTYTGTYGTNGFYLNFSDTSALTTASNVGLGKDYSGNSNYWVTNNISITAGSTYDAMIDSPTNWSDGTAYGRGNYATLSPLSYYSSATLSNANLSLSLGTTGNSRATLAPVTGKWYSEFTCTSAGGYSGTGLYIAAAAADFSTPLMSVQYCNNGQTYNNSTFSYASYGASWTTNDVIGVAWDCDTQQVTFYKNGVSQGTLTSPSISVTTGGSGFAFVPNAYLTGVTTTFAVNFGQRPFAYTPPSGFNAVNTSNLAAATINNGAQYFAATLWTGDGTSSRAIDNSANTTIATSFKPDFVWQKARSGASNLSHALYDSVRGATLLLSSDQTSAESTLSTGVTAFNSNGFQIGTWPNASSQSQVAWQWKAAGSTVSNTSGSITSTVSAGTTQGFSVVTYTGTGSSATVGHGLGVAPKMVIVKQRSGSGGAWPVWHSAFGTASNSDYVVLNGTGAKGYAGTLDMWNATVPTSSVFSVGTYANVNSNAETYVAYLFAEVAGYSKFGSYTGNGSTDGPMVYLGFRPRYVLLKISSTTGDWVIYDTSRNTYNVVDLYLYPNSSAAEGGSGTPRLDILSNGFKLRQSGQDNTSGATYIYAAFAENPFNISRAR